MKKKNLCENKEEDFVNLIQFEIFNIYKYVKIEYNNLNYSYLTNSIKQKY